MRGGSLPGRSIGGFPIGRNIIALGGVIVAIDIQKISNGGQISQPLSGGGTTGEQASGVGMLGSQEDIAHGSSFDDFPAIHHGNGIGDFGNHPQIVGNENHRHAATIAQLPHEIEDGGLDGDIQGGGGFVGNQQGGIARDRHGNHHPLNLPPGKLVGVAIEHFLFEAIDLPGNLPRVRSCLI